MVCLTDHIEFITQQIAFNFFKRVALNRVRLHDAQ